VVAVSEAISARVTRVWRGIGELGAPLSGEAAAWIAGWISVVQAWNAKIDLTAARGEDELVDLMLADALVLAKRIPASASVVDVGTGAGAPGLGLSLAREDLEVTLVEPMQKRAALLRTVIGELLQAGAPLALAGPRRVRVVRERGEDVARRGEVFGAAVSRATLPPPEWLKLGAKLAPSGEVWVLLAREEPPSLAGWTATEDIRYRWPLTGAERRAVRFTQTAM
jgi:16S rRNA (guanine527-N7)-methyltransferase